jgi:hypothetical protein
MPGHVAQPPFANPWHDKSRIKPADGRVPLRYENSHVSSALSPHPDQVDVADSRRRVDLTKVVGGH